MLTGDSQFEEQRKNDTVIKMKERVNIPLTFLGLHIQQLDVSTITVDQGENIKSIEQLSTTCDYEAFRSEHHKIAWTAATRPDVMGASNIFSQVTPKSFNVSDVKAMNKVICYLKVSIDAKLRYPPHLHRISQVGSI